METCGSVCASCVCIRPKKHDGPHVCQCGGAQLNNGEKAFAVPGARWGLTPETVEKYAAGLPKRPMTAREFLEAL